LPFGRTLIAASISEGWIIVTGGDITRKERARN